MPDSETHIVGLQHLKKQQRNFSKSVVKSNGYWQIQNRELMDKHRKQFQKFINSTNFDTLQITTN